MRKGIQRAGRIAAIALASTLVIGGSANLLVQADAATPVTAEVKIDNFSFGPVSLTVAPGTKVTWTNRDDIPHTVVADDKTFKSKVLDTDETFSYTFDKPGTYPYFCSIHPHMTGQIVVK
ncbi:MAG TPA: cupredoxin family copper-binding protein [Candidatus Polarisedimenticolaceae bacterium]|nr:cupredoxin family copper-binding protein [Candidatus Polarisedimenticolaceae bacterium]